jgi:hypothetical protein
MVLSPICGINIYFWIDWLSLTKLFICVLKCTVRINYRTWNLCILKRTLPIEVEIKDWYRVTRNIVCCCRLFWWRRNADSFWDVLFVCFALIDISLGHRIRFPAPKALQINFGNITLCEKTWSAPSKSMSNILFEVFQTKKVANFEDIAEIEFISIGDWTKWDLLQMLHNNVFGSFGLTCYLDKENNSQVGTAPPGNGFWGTRNKSGCAPIWSVLDLYLKTRQNITAEYFLNRFFLLLWSFLLSTNLYIASNAFGKVELRLEEEETLWGI